MSTIPEMNDDDDSLTLAVDIWTYQRLYAMSNVAAAFDVRESIRTEFPYAARSKPG